MDLMIKHAFDLHLFSYPARQGGVMLINMSPTAGSVPKELRCLGGCDTGAVFASPPP